VSWPQGVSEAYLEAGATAADFDSGDASAVVFVENGGVTYVQFWTAVRGAVKTTRVSYAGGVSAIGGAVVYERPSDAIAPTDSALPYDAEVDFVTVPAGAYILPEAYGVSGDLYVSMSVRLPTTGVTTSTPFFCGNWRGSGISTQIKVEGSTAARFMSFNGSETTLTIPSDTLGKFSTISLGGNKFAVESASTTGTVSSAVSKPCDFGIGACAYTDNTTPNARQFDFDIASFQFDCATAHRSLVPVRVGQVGYLYDKVSGRLFGSAVGSIPLVPGPDKA
jgi:hypothetical protein